MKTPIKTFIEDAIKGGWYELSVTQKAHRDGIWCDMMEDIVFHIHKILLDPKAWEAVGNVRGWNDEEECRSGCGCEPGSFEQCHEGTCVWDAIEPIWKAIMNDLMPALQDGSSIEEYLKTLEV